MQVKLLQVMLLLAAAVQVRGQDYTFSQFYAQPLMRNPALGGVFTGNVRFQSVYRNQWQSVTVPFRTAALSAELKLPSENFTIGMQVTHDIAGDSKLSRTQVLPSVSGHVFLSENTMLTGAFMGGLVNSQYDPTALQWDDQFVNGQFNASNPTNQVIKNTTRNYWDLSTGLSVQSAAGNIMWYAGAAMYHVMKPRVDFSNSSLYRLSPRWAINTGITMPAGETSSLFMYADCFIQGGHRQYLLGAIYAYDLIQYDEDQKVSLSFGSLYRWNDALIPVIKLDWYEWNLGLSYDINVSKLKTASESRGGFEITLGYRGFLAVRNEYTRQTKCKWPGL